MKKRLIILIAVLAGLLSYTDYAVANLLLGSNDLPPWIGALAITILWFGWMISGMVLYRLRPQLFERALFKAYGWMGSILMALWATYILLSIPFSVAHFFVPSLSWQVIDLGVLILAGVLTAIGMVQALQGPRIREYKIAIPKLAASLKGLRLVQISDVHVGPTIRRGYVEKIAKLAKAARPDMIFFTGDIADGKSEWIAEHLEPFKDLSAKYGKFFVTGNHEYYGDALKLIELMRGQTMIPLINENVVVSIGESKVMIAGVTDPAGETMLAGHTPDIKRASLTQQNPSLRILLAHRPDAVLEAEPLGFDMQFSGHTHAGQFFPFSLLIGLAHKYYRGLYRHGKTWLHVNPGTGYWGPVDRLWVRPEVTVIILEDGDR